MLFLGCLHERVHDVPVDLRALPGGPRLLHHLRTHRPGQHSRRTGWETMVSMSDGLTR